jgi:TatA/E family protein of Tat protein translocase
MLSLDPEKLFIVLIVALVLLGPDKLPKLARQLGAGWAKLREFQQRMEQEVREAVPELPSTEEIVRIARSPVSYLNSLAESPDARSTSPADEVQIGQGTLSHGTLDRPAPLAGTPSSPPHRVPLDPGMN